MFIERKKLFFKIDKVMTFRENVTIMSHNTNYSSEHYQQIKMNMNVRKLIQRVYDKNSENMLNLIKNF